MELPEKLPELWSPAQMPLGRQTAPALRVSVSSEKKLRPPAAIQGELHFSLVVVVAVFVFAVAMFFVNRVALTRRGTFMFAASH